MDKDLKPVLILKNKNLKAKYYSDGSGFLVVESKRNNQDVFIEESGTFKDHIQELKLKINLMKKAVSTLEKVKRARRVKFKKAWWCK